MKEVVVFRWGLPHPGREAEAMAFAAESEAGFRELIEQGVVDRFEWIVNTTGADDDIAIAWGDEEKLMAVMKSEEMDLLRAKGRYLLERFRWDLGRASEHAEEAYAAWGRTLMEQAAHATA